MSGHVVCFITTLLATLPAVGHAASRPTPPAVMGHWTNTLPGCRDLCGLTVIACEASYHQLYMAYDKGRFQAEASGYLKNLGHDRYVQIVAGKPIDFTLKGDKLCAGKPGDAGLCQTPGTVFKKSATPEGKGAGVTCHMAKIILDNTIPK